MHVSSTRRALPRHPHHTVAMQGRVSHTKPRQFASRIVDQKPILGPDMTVLSSHGLSRLMESDLAQNQNETELPPTNGLSVC